MRRSLLLTLLLGLTSTGCGDDDTMLSDASTDALEDTAEDASEDTQSDGEADADEPDFPLLPNDDDCENLNPAHCMMPWPSTRFLVSDDTSETGYRVAIPDGAFPTNQFDAPASTTAWNRLDGFSPQGPAMTLLPGPIEQSMLSGEEDIPASLETSNTTILVDAESGELVAHFADLDLWPGHEPGRTSLYIHPATRLQENHRYIVAVQGLQTEDGADIEPFDTFKALRDDTELEGAPDLEARRENFEDIFTILESAGVQRGGLIEAWDFHTASGQALRGPLFAMRDSAIEQLGESGIGCTVTSSEDSEDGDRFRRIEGTITVPLFMETDEPGSVANWQDDGIPAANGTYEIPFWAYVPQSVREQVMAGDGPAPVMIYGHGLLGSGTQAGSGGPRTATDRNKMISVGIDWLGLSDKDLDYIVGDIFTGWHNFGQAADQLMQGGINHVALARTINGACRELPEFQIEETPMVAEDEIYYFGISQGGIMGGTFAALTPDVERFVLQVGAISYPLMVRRSSNFEVYEGILATWYPNSVDRQVMVAAAGMLWDLSDPGTFAPLVLSGGEGVPFPKKVLYQISRWDLQVPNIGSDMAGRTYGLDVIEGSVYTPWNMEMREGPLESAWVCYDVGVDPLPPGTRPPMETPGEDKDAHSDLRFFESMQQQLGTFLQPDGMIENFCDGDCGPDEPRTR